MVVFFIWGFCMNILIVDRDDVARELVKARLEEMGHIVWQEASKANIDEMLTKEDFDAIFIDPSPLNNPRQLVLNIRRKVRKRSPYLVFMSDNATYEDALKAGMNDLLMKPVDMAALENKVENAIRLNDLIERIGDSKEDFPSSGGVIAKSAFNQLFLSAIDRADRYGERSFVLFISVSNYNELLAMDGPYVAETAAATMAQHLVRLRRQSDIIAQTGKAEYALMLQRPIYETEPMDAANRFAESLSEINDLGDNVELNVYLVDIPVGKRYINHVFRPSTSSYTK